MPINWILGHKPYQYGHKLIEILETIGVLIHLRLLHILDTEINYLTNSITKLFNLQTLRIECPDLIKLPKDLSNLINLRHICILIVKVQQHLKMWGG